MIIAAVAGGARVVAAHMTVGGRRLAGCPGSASSGVPGPGRDMNEPFS